MPEESLLTISDGVLGVATTAYHVSETKPGSVSDMPGPSARAGCRALLASAMAWSFSGELSTIAARRCRRTGSCSALGIDFRRPAEALGRHARFREHDGGKKADCSRIE